MFHVSALIKSLVAHQMKLFQSIQTWSTVLESFLISPFKSLRWVRLISSFVSSRLGKFEAKESTLKNVEDIQHLLTWVILEWLATNLNNRLTLGRKPQYHVKILRSNKRYILSELVWPFIFNEQKINWFQGGQLTLAWLCSSCCGRSLKWRRSCCPRSKASCCLLKT